MVPAAQPSIPSIAASSDFFTTMKRIKLERQAEVRTLIRNCLLVTSQGASSRKEETVESVLEEYFTLPPEDFECLR